MSAAEAQRSAAVDTTALLDQVDWAVTGSVVAYGVRICVRVNDQQVADELSRHLPPGFERIESSDVGRTYSLVVERDERAGKSRYSVYVDVTLLARCSTLPGLLRAFESDVQLYVAEMATERVFVHAGVVGCQGRAILFPGRSFSGKTTLVAALVRAGADYYSDEYAVLDAAGHVHPYPRALSVRQARGGRMTKEPVDALGGHTGTTPLPVGLVVVTKFRSGRHWSPVRLSPGAGILALLANTVAARRIPAIALATLRQVVAAAPVITSERGEASTVVAPILDCVCH